MTSPTVQLLIPDIAQMLEAGQFREVREALRHLAPADAAELIHELQEPASAVAFRVLPRDEAAEIFSELPPESQEELISQLGDERAARVIEEMDPDDRAKLLDELPAEVSRQIMQRLTPQTRRITQTILNYPPESVGRLMTPDYVRVRPEWTVAKALEHIRRWGRDAETINWVFVIDRKGQLIDDLRIREILLADPEQTIESLMDHEFVSLFAKDDREEAVRVMARYDRNALPVVDSRGVLVGIVTFDDVADVAEEEFTEDIHKLGGLEAFDEPYDSVGLATMIRKRGGWLALLFVMQVGTIGIISFFDDQLAKAVVLASFIPLVISCGGNTGSQAATILVRALSLGQISARDWWYVARRELLTGFGLGIVLGLLGFITVSIANSVGFVQTEHALQIGAAVAVSVILIVTWATIVGSMLPIILRGLGLDPATSSTPLVATLMDVSGLTIYFVVAMVLLHGVVL
ncbi:MAG: magnesium transporter [Planctomycetota bacterium]|nr:MAG: magnesium transporter [Planctomycetota bacterium]